MKSIIYKLRFLLFVFLTAIITLNAKSQVQSTDGCTMLGNNISISLISASGTALTDVKSGLDFNLNLTLPGQNNCNGTYNVIVNTSSNLSQGSTAPSYPYPFVNSGNNEYTNGPVLSSGTGGIGICIPFKFKPGVTCNGETGTFKVTITLTCADGTKHECILNVALKAIAINYWVVEKKHVFGNLSGGGIYWDIIIKNTNGTRGIGDLNIYNGSINDILSSDEIISVSGGSLSGLVGLYTPNASWFTGTILSTTDNVVYHVQTYSCKPAGTVVQNCVKYDFCLGKEIKLHPYDPNTSDQKELKGSNERKPVAAGFPGPIGPVKKPCCYRLTGQTCASVTLVGTPTTSANFSKSLTYGTNLNYSQGCEGEYLITVSNNGNIPLNNLIISDNFPSGINVFEISVAASNPSMTYDIPFGTPSTGFNTSGPNYSQTWTTGFPTTFKLITTSGTLLGGTITIHVKFKIVAPTGTNIKNCADLNYNGTYDGWSNWCNIQLPPPSQNGVSQSCVSFKVEPAKAIPGITKCIPSGQQTYSVGDPIHFRIVISNHGAANFSGNLTDLLGPTPQNLQLIPGSVTYSHGIGYFNPYSTSPVCIGSTNLSTPSTWTPPTLTGTLQNLSWNISNMPGICELNKAYYLIIDFEVTVLPQSFGNYQNTALLGTLHGDAYYNIMRVAKIVTTKQASTEFVEPGQTFSYIVNVKNAGSVGLNNIKIVDVLPPCVTYSNCSANKLDANGVIISGTTPTYSSPNFTFPVALNLLPGESVTLIITITRNANDQTPVCCNLLAKGIGITTDAVHMLISDEKGPACVKSGLCCDIKDMDVQFNTTFINGTLVTVFLISGGSLPIQEIEISLMDYHVVYNNLQCKPLNMGNLFGHIQPFVGTDDNGNYWNFYSLPGTGNPVLPLQTLVNPVNNSLTWAGSNPIDLSGSSWASFLNGLIALNLIAPDILSLECCSGTLYYCFKVRIKDVNCNVCEKIVCGSAEIPKKKQPNWKNEKAKDQHQIQSIENSPGQIGKGKGFPEFFKINNQQKQ